MISFQMQMLHLPRSFLLWTFWQDQNLGKFQTSETLKQIRKKDLTLESKKAPPFLVWFFTSREDHRIDHKIIC